MPKRMPISEQQLIEALARFGGHRGATARYLDISVRTLARRLRENPDHRWCSDTARGPPWLEELWRLEHTVLKAALDKSTLVQGFHVVNALPTDKLDLRSFTQIKRRLREISNITAKPRSQR
jgi:hypothetical protein